MCKGKFLAKQVYVVILMFLAIALVGCNDESRFIFTEGTIFQESLDQQIGKTGSFGAYKFKKVGNPISTTIWQVSYSDQTKKTGKKDLVQISTVLQRWQVREIVGHCSYNPSIGDTSCSAPESTGRTADIYQVINTRKVNPSLENNLPPSDMYDTEKNKHLLVEDVVVVVGDVYSTNAKETQGIWIVSRIEKPSPQ